jgi:chloramphenicol O-acetyltransferase
MDPKFLDFDSTKLCFEILFKETETLLQIEKDYSEIFSKFKDHYIIKVDSNEQELVASFSKTFGELVSFKAYILL